ncbi:glycosyltransferase family 4 protein [Actinomarinicola tropica]|uniref:Glycosyltransferase n=1 Tax=Actinomarinicola tropica TaxID=2789776 RepID=A0A5Q2RRK9_9ACTN|nr:glycosyltransferase family 1 protein [Actinomarinicola tropica]QGG95825.1 glycosyltransferase [Actinomarinicola tropica]
MRVAVTLEQCWHRVPGGTARAAIEQVRAVAARGDVDQVGVSARHREGPEEAWVPPIEVRQLPLPRLALYESWHHLGRPPVERATGPVDVVHATGVAVPPRTAPLVVTVHDLAVLHDPDQFTRRGVSFMRKAIELTAARADLVLCSSRATLDDCRVQGFPSERLRLVPLGVAAEEATADEVARVRQSYGLTGRYVLFVGTIEPRKNLRGLLDAFRRVTSTPELADVTLALVGPPGWGEDLAPRVAALGDRCRTLGFVPTDDLRALHAGADAFCYPSLLEGFGLPVLEAMVQGTPVVTSAGTATEELVEGGAGLAVPPRDPAAIAAALVEVLTDEDVARSLGEAGRRRSQQYTWARTAELVVDAYRDAAG